MTCTFSPLNNIEVGWVVGGGLIDSQTDSVNLIKKRANRKRGMREMCEKTETRKKRRAGRGNTSGRQPKGKNKQQRL